MQVVAAGLLLGLLTMILLWSRITWLAAYPTLRRRRIELEKTAEDLGVKSDPAVIELIASAKSLETNLWEMSLHRMVLVLWCALSQGIPLHSEKPQSDLAKALVFLYGKNQMRFLMFYFFCCMPGTYLDLTIMAFQYVMVPNMRKAFRGIWQRVKVMPTDELLQLAMNPRFARI